MITPPVVVVTCDGAQSSTGALRCTANRFVRLPVATTEAQTLQICTEALPTWLFANGLARCPACARIDLTAAEAARAAGTH